MKPLVLTAQDGAQAEISPYGSQVLSWRPAVQEREQLFLTPRSLWMSDRPIRGGVPVIFPQFGSLGSSLKHGFARVSDWQPIAVGTAADGAGQAILHLRDSPATRAWWPHPFTAEVHLRVGGDTLRIELRIENTGQEKFAFTAALHTYLRVDDIAHTRVAGLQGLRYRDAVSGTDDCLESSDALAIRGEVDRIYFDSRRPLLVSSPGNGVAIEASGFRDTVIWNPGAERTRAFPDLAPEDYQHLLCVEAAAIGTPIALNPGEEWRGTQVLRAEPGF
ncbi:MAG: D-hexose-6-phosphate mutarotase [Sterolibacterium sp.]|jgi:glucose-6-phosphate 1-epimerase